MPQQDDSDVKIFGKPADLPDENDLLETAAFLNRQRNNGNVAKAKALGEELAMLDAEKAGGISLNILLGAEMQLNTAVINQIRALAVFIAQTAMHKRLRVQLLSSCAVNAMYDKITDTSYGFYQAISDGAAFTFYSLSLKDDDPTTSIGEHFAMLCGMEGNVDFQAFGSSYYKSAGKAIEQAIDKYNFEGIQ